MFAPDQYQLLDFGEGRKLERLGGYVVDRPSPAAEGVSRASPELWSTADARFLRAGRSRPPDGTSPSSSCRPAFKSPVRRPGPTDDGRWEVLREPPNPWTISHGAARLRLLLTPFGHLGVFPEHAENWDWISDVARGAKVLNLFAYTGGATLAAAAAGAEVVHVDSAKSAVAWAARNAELSGLADAPIRWIIDDARKFVARELRRGNSYAAVILDPPSYGHGPKGQAWQVDQHLAPLLADCARLIEGRRRFFLLTCHSPGYGPAELGTMLVNAGINASWGEGLTVANGQVLPRNWLTASEKLLGLTAADGRTLPSGAVARWAFR
jgi:23S rRNA (cytosine1962-C5)-methyltransferase